MVPLVRLALIAALTSLLALSVASTAAAGGEVAPRAFVHCVKGAPPGPFNVRADDVSCDRAWKIAKKWVRKSRRIEAIPDHVKAWNCSTKQTGYESSTTVCRRSGKRIKFSTGA
jgi:hypothetical protein